MVLDQITMLIKLKSDNRVIPILLLRVNQIWSKNFYKMARYELYHTHKIRIRNQILTEKELSRLIDILI